MLLFLPVCMLVQLKKTRQNMINQQSQEQSNISYSWKTGVYQSISDVPAMGHRPQKDTNKGLRQIWRKVLKLLVRSIFSSVMNAFSYFSYWEYYWISFLRNLASYVTEIRIPAPLFFFFLAAKSVCCFAVLFTVLF